MSSRGRGDGKHAVDLFRLGVFSDRYRVLRQGVRAGVENYSIKRLEPLCGYGRRVDLAEARASLIALEAALEDGTAAGDGERQRVVADYNEDDYAGIDSLQPQGRIGRQQFGHPPVVVRGDFYDPQFVIGDSRAEFGSEAGSAPPDSSRSGYARYLS